MGRSRLKPGWTRVAFGDVVRLSTERTSNPSAEGFERYIGLEHLDPGNLAIRRWGDVANGTTFTTVFRPGQVLFGKRRAYQCKVAVPDFAGVCSGDIYVLEPSDDRHLLPELLPFVCQTDSFFGHAIGTSAGSLSPRTNWRSLAAYEFALPPLDEQQRIADLLGTSCSVGNALARLVSSIEHARQSIISCAAEGTRGSKVRIEDLCEMQNGRPFPRSDYSEQGLRLLRPGNLGANGRLTWEPSKTVCLPERWHDDARDFVVRNGDVLINLTAQSLDDRFMGRICVAGPADISLLNQRIGRFLNWSDDILPEYVSRVLQSTRFQQHVTSMCEGSKVKHLFWFHIGRFAVHVPPTPKQEAIVGVLQSVDGLLNAVARRIEDNGCCMVSACLYSTNPTRPRLASSGGLWAVPARTV